ncbi:hypothetical protein, partial [Pseudomonas helleri]|uniref:hypothetical protein n=1 Tax=Pseudomonas helleri TaxID=1608996 RepID=UPI001E5E23B8
MPWRCGMMLRLQFNNRVALSSCNRQVFLFIFNKWLPLWKKQNPRLEYEKTSFFKVMYISHLLERTL